MQIGFIGGCINNPVGVRTEDVYHTILRTRFPQLDICLASYHTYSRLLSHSEHLIKKHEPAVLFVFIRNFPYMGLNKPFIKLMGRDKKKFYKLHPSLIKRQVKTWPPEYDQFVERYSGEQFPIRKYFALRDLNLMAGVGVGLHHWAVTYVKEIIADLNKLCNNESVQLVLIGPPKNPETFTGEIISTYLNKKVKEFSVKKNIPFIDINMYRNTSGNSVLQEDKIHFGKHGHAVLAEKVQEVLVKIKVQPALFQAS